MGLTNMSVDDFEKAKEILKFLEDVFGITEEDLREYPNIVAKYKNANIAKTFTRTEKEKQVEELANKAKSKPEDILKMFEGDVEEFYPNGR